MLITIDNNINNFLNKRKEEKNKYTFIPPIKHLTIIACHINNMQKLITLQQNIYFLSFCNNDIIVINSSNLLFNETLKSEILNQDKNEDKNENEKEKERENKKKNRIIQYLEITNNKWMDFGKWKHVIENIDYSNYDFVTFTNDSFSIHKPICFFYNLATEKNVELFGYTSSSEIKYHYQSYLFTLKKDAVLEFNKYLNKYIDNEIKIKNKITPIHLEINLIDVFLNKDCFLDIGNILINRKKNVFFDNPFLYNTLFTYNLLPFIKLKLKLKLNLKNKFKPKLDTTFYNNTSMTFSPNIWNL